MKTIYRQRVVTILSRSISLVTLAVAGLAGCGLNITNPAMFNGASTGTTNPIDPAPPVTATTPASIPLKGYVGGEQWAVSGASIQLYAMGSVGAGSSATALLTQPVSTDSNGNFVIDQAYSCPSPMSQLYLVASGGNAGQATGTSNPAIRLLTVIGSCSDLSSSAIYPINEVTTIGSIWPLKSYITSATQIGSGSADAQFTAAMRNVNELVDVQKGTAPGVNIPSGYAVQTEKLNTLADDLHGCVASPGGAAGDGTVCGQLFSNTTAAGASGPIDTFEAALGLAQSTQLNAAALFQSLSTNAVFEPVLEEKPADWNLDLLPVPAAPVIQPAGGTYSSGQQITLSTSDTGAALHYTLDGSTPTQSSSTYDAPLVLTAAETVRAIVVTGEISSPVTSSTFTLATPHLVFTSQPSSINSGSMFSPLVAISVVDNAGKAMQVSVPVSLTLVGGDSNSSLNGPAVVTTSNGIASYGGLGVTGGGSGYSLVASSAGMSSVSSVGFSVASTNNQSPVLALSLASSSIDVGGSGDATVTLSKPALSGGMKVQISSSDQGVLSLAPSVVTIPAGQTAASFTYTGIAPGTVSLTASSSGATSGTAQVSVKAAPAKATHLVFTTQPLNIVAGSVFSPVVSVSTVDDAGKLVSSSAVIALSLSGTTPNSALIGTVNAAATNGVATFLGLGESIPGNGFSLMASSPGLGTVSSSAFDVAPVAADVPQISLTLASQSMHIGDALTGRVNLSKPAGSGGMKIQLSANSPNVISIAPALLTIAAGQSYGVVTYAGLSAGSTTLTASAAGSNVSSAQVTVVAKTPSLLHLVFSVQPKSVLAGTDFSPAPTVSVMDSSGNLVTSSKTEIVLTLTAANGSAASLEGTSTLVAWNGVAVFSGIDVATAGSGYTITATSTDAGAVTSDSFDVTAPVSASLIPASATVSNNLEASGNWRWNHDPGTPGSSTGTSVYGISNPSMNGASRIFSLNYSGHGGEIYHLSFGLDPYATHFVYESYIYIADPSQLQNIEMDMNHVTASGLTVILGTQCATGSKTWEYTKVANGGTHWYASNIPCDPRSWTANSWHHVQIASHHDSQGVATYDWVSVDGVQTNFKNAVGPSGLSLGWQKGDLLINFQLDGYNRTSGAITVYTNKMAMYRW